MLLLLIPMSIFNCYWVCKRAIIIDIMCCKVMHLKYYLPGVVYTNDMEPVQ